MISLTLKNLTKKFGEVTAVDSVNLDVPPGKLVALLGPSGCGKTTTLNIIAGLMEPTEGDVYFNNQVVTHIPAEKRKIGMVFQRYVLFPHMNVFENIAFGLRMQKRPKSEIHERVLDVIKLVQLEGFEKRHPVQLSGGQMQRVAIARAVVIKPNLLLMDEPLANLDAKLRLEMREFIRNLQRQLGITTLFVTHDQAEAAVLADQVAVMFNGRFHQFSDPLTLFNCPQSIRVASFMGSVNIIDGRIEEKMAGGYILSSSIGLVRARQNQAKDWQQGDHVLFSIRPDHIQVFYPEDSQNRENVFTLTFKDMIYEGDMVKYFLGDEKGQEIQAHTPSTQFFTESEKLSVYMDPKRVWIIPER